jgi:phage-related protein
MSWQVVFYESTSGQNPVEDFLEKLQPSTLAKLRNQVRLLAEYGPKLMMPHAKPIGDGLYELRVRGKEEVRSLYIFMLPDKIVLLHVFKKKQMAIRNKDLAIAIARKKEIETSV